MPFKTVILKPEKRINVTATNPVDFASSSAMINQLNEDLESLADFKIRIDARGVKWSPSVDRLRVLAGLFAGNKHISQSAVAIIVSDQKRYLLAEMLCLGAALGGFWRIRTFMDPDRANEWLDHDQETAGQS